MVLRSSPNPLRLLCRYLGSRRAFTMVSARSCGGQLKFNCGLPNTPPRRSRHGVHASRGFLQRLYAVEVDGIASSNAGLEDFEPRIAIESVTYEDGSFNVCGTMRHAAPRQVVYDTLVDYDALPRYVYVGRRADGPTGRRADSD